ncbi:MAG TPA: helix-turn-helix domain-containing protein, partial [Chitinophagales bacterium]|nr:helix-turn-helix domain-containing protein [Chitinophagales bacterium]
QILISYRFPGNVRELKNIAEQVSVLSKEKTIGKEELARFIPTVEQNTLPTITHNNETTSFTDRELLYKMIFDIKHDLNDLKSFVWNMSNGNFDDTKIDFSDVSGIEKNISNTTPNVMSKQYPVIENTSGNPTIILNDEPQYEEESIDSSLSLADMEKSMIIKALDKHKGKRRDAALDLGISERTLYRKIKEYKLEE